jgi:hypothetical protein
MSYKSTKKRSIAATLCILHFAFCMLTSCATAPLLSDVTAGDEVLRPTGNGESIAIQYHVGRDARVSIAIEDSSGTRYMLREDEPRLADSDPYTMRFDGTVPIVGDPQVQRRLLPSGSYTYIVSARPDDGGAPAEQRGQLRIEGSDVEPPRIENLLVSPATISPNGDAIADVAEITYRLPVTATMDIEITAPDGSVYTLVARSEEPAAEQYHVWNGRRPDNVPLPNGVYTYTVRAQDLYGNVVRRQGSITLADVGQPEATITYASIAPVRVMLGELITVTVRVKNSGTVPIRTYGPPSGYAYTTDDVFSSVEDGRYSAKPGGFWRVGLDWDAKSGGGARRYPFRWALSERPAGQWRSPGEEDLLLPGEEVTIVGQVRILQPETKMGFYVGLIQDGVGFFQDRTARTIVEVGF